MKERTMTTTAKPVTWFEIGSNDTAATKEFYGRLFGWTFNGDDSGEVDYTMIDAGDGIKGGIFGMPAGMPSYAVFYVEVPDVATSCREVEEAGGKVIVEPTSTPDGLVFAQFLDPHSNQIGLFSPPSAA
jgi:predicted enzyme related to lactoylglutathione lyase